MTRRLNNRTLRWCAGIAAAAGIYVVYLLRLEAHPAMVPPAALAPGFAGDDACFPCHANLARQAQTHHALALRTTAEFRAAAALPPSDWVRDPGAPISYRMAEREGAFGVEAHAAAETRWQPVEWAFGAGDSAMTPVGRAPGGGYVEAPLTAYRHAGWEFTVGYLAQLPTEREQHPTGTPMTAEEAFPCFDCHATGVRRSPAAVILAGAREGVRCERCHGPSAAHVAAARAGRPQAGTVIPGRPSAAAMVEFCATCHRSTTPGGLKATDPVVVRFAPIGFSRSRCFRESGGRLSCVTCHDPHGDASHDPNRYNEVCAQCHGGNGSHLRTCPVQPRGNCVSCHMPRRIIQRNSIFTDHWIRIVAGPQR